jgi:hypothetical protein
MGMCYIRVSDCVSGGALCVNRLAGEVLDNVTEMHCGAL